MKKLGIAMLAAILSIGFVGCMGGECTHEYKTKMPMKAATCMEEGNQEYWLCHDCSKYFKDEACTQECTYNEMQIPYTPHTFGEGLYCTNSNCRAEKPYTTELAGHTYYVYGINLFYDMSAATEAQNTALNNLIVAELAARRMGSLYTFDAQGGVSAKHIVYYESLNEEREQLFTATYVQTGDTFTMSRVDNAGTPDEEVETETYELDEYGRWVQTVEVPSTLVAGYEGAKLVVILQEQQDHILRCKEGQSVYTRGICEYCGGEEPKLMEVEGTTWKFASAEFGYEDGVEKHAAVEAFVQSYFEDFLNTTYTFNADGTVTASAGSVKDWVQYGNQVELDILVGVTEEQQPVYWRAVCLLDEEGLSVSYYFTTAEMEGAGIPEVYNRTGYAIIRLTLVP